MTYCQLRLLPLCIFKKILLVLQWFLFILVYACSPLIKRFPFTLSYHIDQPTNHTNDHISPVTEIIFTKSGRTNQKYCLKTWQVWRDELYDTADPQKRLEYLLEGLQFNRQFAPKVYLGIAEIKRTLLDSSRQGQKLIQRSQPIKHPERHKERLKKDAEYVLVMRQLSARKRLDQQLISGKLCTLLEMDFLANEIVSMHHRLAISNIGLFTQVESKLNLNIKLFELALHQLHISLPEQSQNQNQETKDLQELVEDCRKVPDLLRQFYIRNQSAIEKRYTEGSIRRCHGDLKATNLWLSSYNFFGLQLRRRLLALDCIDFRPEFCHIDTLSDVAMLAIDIEMRLSNGSILAERFLQSYRRAFGESDEVIPILEYYLIEKAIVYVCMSILYDKQDDLGIKYLHILMAHIQKLEGYLKSSTEAQSEEIEMATLSS